MLLLAALLCCDPPDAPALACPSGMVLVEGGGRVGMRGQPYGIVQTAHLDRVEAPERGCEAAIAASPGAVTCWVQTDLVDPVLAVRDVALDPFCIDAFPFPGEGARYTTDGMTAWDAQRLGELLATGRFGARRLCTLSELQVAVAGPRANRRFAYGDGAPEGCPDDQPIGADPACSNPETGVHDYGAVMSHWVVADADFAAHACAGPPCRGAGGNTISTGDLVVAGGTRRAQTRQAPLTPHTWHDHGEPTPAGCDDMGHDDQPAICADPGPATAEQERAWEDLVAVARKTGRMTAVLEAGLGRPVCPASGPP